ncbi:MAG TPA: hypothetical protein VGL18_01050 [Actinomycetota bacterium]
MSEAAKRLGRSPETVRPWIRSGKLRSYGAANGELGWAKTYDAEYIALARLMRCRLISLDARLLRGAARLGFVIGLDELYVDGHGHGRDSPRRKPR